MKSNPIPYHRIRSIRQLRRARERIGWRLGVTEEKIHHDYRHIVDMLTIANIAKLAATHIQSLRELFEAARDGFQSIRGFFSRTRPHDPEALEAKSETPEKNGAE